MRLSTVLLVAVLSSNLMAQSIVRTITRPELPSRDALEKLNLRIAWNTRIRTDGSLDGILSFQYLPGEPRNQLLVQTYYGQVYLFDAETGDLHWKTTIGMPYWSGYAAAANSHSIYVTRRDYLYCLSRDRGFHRFVTIDPITQVRDFGFKLNYPPSAGASADEDAVYFAMNDRVLAYTVPNFEVITRGRRAYKESDLLATPTSSYMPEPRWSYYEPTVTFAHPPLPNGKQVGLVTNTGEFFSFNKYDRALRFEYKTFGPITAQFGTAMQPGRLPGSIIDFAYIGSSDYMLHAINLNTGNIVWKALTGGPIQQPPLVTDLDVLVVSNGKGLFRIDRLTGREYWRNPDATRVLGLNNKFVYALSRANNLLVLDGLKGTTLSCYDMADWQVALMNDWTDRLYFANHDGQILCMHLRDLREPLTLRTFEPWRLPGAALPPPVK